MARPRKPASGEWRPVPGSARRYRNTRTGDTISRRQYDNLRARRAGFRNRYDLERFRESIAGSRWISDVYAANGRNPTMQEYEWIREVTERRAALGTPAPGEPRRDQRDPALVAPNGPLARLLNATGRRPLNGRPVGSS